MTLIFSNNQFLITGITKQSLPASTFILIPDNLYVKRGTIISLIDRVFYLSYPSFHQKNMELVVNILLNNGYPLFFIFDTLNKRLKTISRHNISNNKTNISNNNNNKDSNRLHYFNIPYIPNFSKQFESQVCGS